MKHLVTKIKRYVKLYLIYCKFSFILNVTYRFSFFVDLFVEIGYSVVTVFFFRIIYFQVEKIAGWSFNELLLLTGINIVFIELLVGFVFTWGFRTLPEKINNGDMDFVLTKPVNSLFSVSLSMPYYSSLITAVLGIAIVIRSLLVLDINLHWVDFLSAGVMLFSGGATAFSILAIISSLSFKFVGRSEILPRIGLGFLTEYTNKPHHIFKGFLRKVFTFVFPVVYMCSLPAASILNGVSFLYVIFSVVLAVGFLVLTIKTWNILVRSYTSASS